MSKQLFYYYCNSTELLRFLSEQNETSLEVDLFNNRQFYPSLA